MRNMLILFMSLVTVNAWAQQVEHPVDFDESFFKKTPYSRWMRDPFKNPPGFAKSPEQKASWPKLSSIVKTGKVPYAVLDGKNIKEGQFIDENRYVSNIGENYVIITEGNFDYELVIVDPKRSLATESGDKK